jgi:glycosyltransferase involved in cell wall biosynthesis
MSMSSGLASRRVAFFQADHRGHRLHFIRLLVENCKGDPCPLLITTTEAIASREFSVHLGELSRAGRLRVVTAGAAREATSRLVSKALAISIEQRVGRLVVPDADQLLPHILTGSFRAPRRRLPKLRLLVMRTPEPQLRLERETFVAVAKIAMIGAIRWSWPGSRCFFLTDAFGVVSSRRGYIWARPVRDPSPALPFVDAHDAKRAVGLPPNSFALGLLGEVGMSKNPDVTLDALRLLPRHVVALFAGAVDRSTAEAIAVARETIGAERVVTIPGYLSNERLGECLSACDAVMLMYDLDAPSGMLASAVEAGVPVIAGRAPWIVRVATELDAGLVAEPTAAGVAEAVQILMARHIGERSPRRAPSSMPSDFTRAMLEN